ncbi:MAG: hypothetical protein JNK82_22275 [Myxococcaceae bacterium]|nr:hypothetical protein [Myxococcaceae bacterium]
MKNKGLFAVRVVSPLLLIVRVVVRDQNDLGRIEAVSGTEEERRAAPDARCREPPPYRQADGSARCSRSQGDEALL